MTEYSKYGIDEKNIGINIRISDFRSQFIGSIGCQNIGYIAYQCISKSSIYVTSRRYEFYDFLKFNELLILRNYVKLFTETITKSMHKLETPELIIYILYKSEKSHTVEFCRASISKVSASLDMKFAPIDFVMG